MIPAIKAITNWSKSQDKNIVKELNLEYKKINEYFFGHKPKVYKSNDVNKR